jgi:hypothetical protein
MIFLKNGKMFSMNPLKMDYTYYKCAHDNFSKGYIFIVAEWRLTVLCSFGTQRTNKLNDLVLKKRKGSQNVSRGR